MPKNNKSVPVVEENTESTKTDPSVSEKQTQEAPTEAMPFDLSKIDPKKLKLAEEMGIPVGQLIAWASSVEQRLQVMQDEMPQKTAQILMRIAEQRRQEQIKQMQENPQLAKRGGMSDLMQIAAMFGGGGAGGMDEEMMSLNKELMKASVQRIKQDIVLGAKRADMDISLAEAIKGLVIRKVAEKTVAGIVE